MTKISKRIKAIKEKHDTTKVYSLDEALQLLAGLTTVNFVESVDVSVNLGVDSRKSDQMVRGSVVLPKGTGKSVIVAVFTQGANVEAAKAAGAELVGYEDLAEQVQAGEFDADIVIASPDAMKIVGRLGQILGPKGLMPNPKDGTVSPNIAEAVKSAKSGQVRFRTDKNGIIHCSIGKINFNAADLKENLAALVSVLNKLKPTAMKGIYLKKISLSSTMGPGITVDLSTL
jgi:large subunit ribosomal protein L1